jgi:hypothetical protein
MKTAHKIITGLIIALGVLHVLVTFHDYDSFSLRALWFASAGVAIILAGFLNLILLRDVGKDKLVKLLAVFTNLFFALLFAAALLLLPQPQVFLGSALFVVATITALAVKSNEIKI